MAYKLLQFEGGFETEDAEMDINYSKSTNYMNPNGTETWNLHSQAKIGTMGYFSFDTEKNSSGNATRLYLVNQNANLSGGILARIENGVIAVGVATAVKNQANTWDATLTGFTSLGAQPIQTLTGLTGTPLNLGTVNVVGVNFTGNFNLKRHFYLINLRPLLPQLSRKTKVQVFQPC